MHASNHFHIAPNPRPLTYFEWKVLSSIPFGYKAGFQESFDTIAKRLPLSKKTVFNIISDLTSYGMVSRDPFELEIDKRMYARTPLGDLAIGEAIWIMRTRHDDQPCEVIVPPDENNKRNYEIQCAANFQTAFQLATDIARSKFDQIHICSAGDFNEQVLCIKDGPQWIVLRDDLKPKYNSNTYNPSLSNAVPRDQIRLPTLQALSDMNFLEPDAERLEVTERGSDIQKRINELKEVDEAFKSTIRFIVARVTANPFVSLDCYLLTQPSQLGKGFSSSWENGGTQSDRQDEVMMHFTSFGTEIGFSLKKETLTVYPGGRTERFPIMFPLLNAKNRALAASKIDKLLQIWWENGDLSKADDLV